MPTIEEVLALFLEDCARSSKSGRGRKDLGSIIGLFQRYLNNYAYKGLNAADQKLLERHRKEGNQFDFCQIFGPDKISDNVSHFVASYLIRKVSQSPPFLGKAAKTLEELCIWIMRYKSVNKEKAKLAAEHAARAAINLPRAARAAKILWAATLEGADFGSKDFDCSGYMDISRIEEDCVWIKPPAGRVIGPLVLPPGVAELLEPSWEINCALARSRGRWHFVEVVNIYPH